MSTESIEFYQGDDKKITVTVKDSAGVAVNLSGLLKATYALAKKEGGTPVLSKSLGAGITVTNALGGVLEITLDAADTAALYGSFYHELELKDAAGKFATVMDGTATIKKAIIPSV